MKRWVWSFHNYNEAERKLQPTAQLRRAALLDVRLGRDAGSTAAPSCGAPRAAAG